MHGSYFSFRSEQTHSMIYFSCFLCFLAASFERSQHFGDTPAKHLEACDMREQQEEESFLRVAKF